MSIKIDSETFATGTVLRKPPGATEGYWAGAPGAFYEQATGDWYLSYRLRRPRGVDPDRGGETRIARSRELSEWQDLKAIEKEALSSSSIERCALHKTPSGDWRYFPSYVDPADGRWCIGQMSAPQVADLRPEEGKILFRAADFSLEGIKDPWIFQLKGDYHMFVSVAMASESTSESSHQTHDIFNTGECVSATGMAISDNLRDWTWKGLVLKPEGNGWDRYCRRLNSIVPWKHKFVGFYDGSASHHDNYEEKSGLVISDDLTHWKVLSPDVPALISPEGSGSLRYIEAKAAGTEVQIFYEYSLANRSHDLRHLSMSLEDWEKQNFEN